MFVNFLNFKKNLNYLFNMYCFYISTNVPSLGVNDTFNTILANLFIICVHFGVIFGLMGVYVTDKQTLLLIFNSCTLCECP